VCVFLVENGWLNPKWLLFSQGHITKPLLVLLDVRMPGMDGRECALQIQELVKQRLGHCSKKIGGKQVGDEYLGNPEILSNCEGL